MNTRFGQSAEQSPAQTMQGVKEIPYDYVATFKLEGKRGNRIQDVINISVEGSFVVVSIGYSFIPPEKLSSLGRAELSGVVLSELPPLQNMLINLLIKLGGIDFKYSIVDSATGRELQNKFIHNIAGLGEAAGNRPFRPMAKPILFQPRSTIRVEIEEISEGPQFANAELYIVLHGYKMLGHGAGLS